MLMVESVVRYGERGGPTLVAVYRVTGSEPVFASRRPATHWPAVHVIEGLGQACLILTVLRRFAREDATSDAELGAMIRAPNMGLLAAVSVEVQGAAGPGDDLRYRAVRTHSVGELSRFRVSAHVGGRLIASGTIVGAAGP